MKFFNWMQSKFRAGDNGDNMAKVFDEKNINPKEEVMSDWRNGLLTIGTLGYKDDTFKHKTTSFALVENTEIPREEECRLSPDFSEFSTEEVRGLQKELTKLLPLHKFLNYPSTLQLDSHSDNIDRTIRIILERCKDAGEKKRTIGRKSLCFLINKIFLCISTGFDSTPSFRDTFQQSRMEKLMRAMLSTTKIHHRNSIGASPTNNCMEEEYTHIHNAENEERLNAINNGGFKWDKTDSEFIILEM